MVRRQRSAFFDTTISSGITNVAASVNIASTSGLPSEGDFYAHMQDEIVLVTHRSGSTCTIVRGCCGTSAVAHSSGVEFHSISVAEEYTQRLSEAGQIKCMPYGSLRVDDGTVLTSSNFQWFNQSGGATGDGNDGTMYIRSPFHTGNDLTGRARGAYGSGAGDKRFTVHLESPLVTALEPNRLGLYIIENSTGLMYGAEFLSNNGDNTVIARSRSSFLAAGTVVANHGGGFRYDCWFQLDLLWDVGGSNENFIFRYSWDGVHFFDLHTFVVATTNPVYVGMAVSNRHIAGTRFFLNSWFEEDI